MKLLGIFTLLLSLGFPINSLAAPNPKVELKTDLGTIVIELYTKEAPVSVQNFLFYVDSQFYDGTIFHRVVPGFVVQGGGMTFDFNEKKTAKPIKNEANNGLKNEYKSVAMARFSNPDSATSQFYINLQNNPNLNASEKSPGYAVFGKVIDGMDVVEKIAKEPRGMYKAFPEAPNYAVRILKARRLDGNSSTTDDSPIINSHFKDALVHPE